MKLWLWVLLFISSFYVNASGGFIPIDIEGNYEKSGVHVATNTMSNVAMLELENKSDTALSCKGVFRYGPELPVTRKAIIRPGSKKMFKARLFRDVIRLNIIVNCEKAA